MQLHDIVFECQRKEMEKYNKHGTALKRKRNFLGCEIVKRQFPGRKLCTQIFSLLIYYQGNSIVFAMAEKKSIIGRKFS